MSQGASLVVHNYDMKMTTLKRLYKKVSTTHHLNVLFLCSSLSWFTTYQNFSRRHLQSRKLSTFEKYFIR
jgi:hypothetical protein